MSEAATQPKIIREDRPVVTAIVGGGGGCEAILRMVQEDSLGRFRMDIRGVADTNPDATGLECAREMGVELVTTNYRKLYEIPDLGLLIELTGSNDIRDELERTRPRHVRLIDHFGARLFWDLHQAEEGIIQQRTELRERVQAERDWITQIFDSIPDEVLVVDTEMVIRQANASYLRANNVTIDQVRGHYCYDAQQAVRGDCQVALNNCPFIDVFRDKKAVRLVRKHFGDEGQPRYTAIVGAPLTDPDGKITGMIEMTRDITERILLEEELKATEVQLQQFMEMAPLATYVKNRQGQYIEVNPATCELLGRPKSEIVGRTDLEILPRETAEILRAGDREVLQKRKEVSTESEVMLHGRRVFLTTTKYPVVDANNNVTAVVGISRDRTARRQAEHDLQQTREYLENILDSSSVIIITTDLKGKIVSFNCGAEVSLGYKAADVVGQPCDLLFPSPDERASLARRVLQDGSVDDYECTLVRKDGSEVPVAMSVSRLTDSTGEPLGTVEIGRDISQRRSLMNQVMQSDRLAAVGRLAAGVAHEINNPLAVISEAAGYMEDLLAGIVDERHIDRDQEFREGLATITAQVNRCSSITHRLLGFSRKTEARIEVTDVKAALDETLPFLEKEARMTNIRIHRQYDEEVSPARIEEVQLEEIIINLITNAIQAMSDRRRGNIWVSVHEENGRVILTVQDDGPGIDEAVRDRLFDPFVTTKMQGLGTGLGLSICYGIVKRYDGEIRVTSEPGEGTTFHVVLRVDETPRG
jgi:PAS domain S-box-containing protein